MVMANGDWYLMIWRPWRMSASAGVADKQGVFCWRVIASGGSMVPQSKGGCEAPIVETIKR